MVSTRKADDDDLLNDLSVNPGYALGQLAKAFHTGRSHPDAATRTRAAKKVEAWVQTFEGILTGALQVGSRTPVEGTPPWATLEVIQGGFATGNLLAEGPLQPHEEALLARLQPAAGVSPRAALNSYFLSDAGVAELRQLLDRGCYRVNVPEEGALLVVAWLLDHGHLDAARTVLDAIGPFLARLRFYPVPDANPLTDSAVVHVQTVGQVAAKLATVEVRDAILALREAIQVWVPLRDRIVDLFLETVNGPVPALRADGSAVEGGWPCQRYPDGWPARARAVLDEYRQLRREHRHCQRPDSVRHSFARLRGYLEICVQDPRRLTGRDVGMIRRILAGSVASRGLPGSPRRQELQQLQARQIAAPDRKALARVLLDRLADRPQDGGLNLLDEVTGPVTAAEAERHELPPGQAVPTFLVNKVRRCLDAPVSELVEAGIIPSGEVLAVVVPQITAQVRAAGIADAALRRLYGAIYAAFRRRRSLLLLNLASQVRLDELPWVRAIDPFREGSLAVREQARQTLEQVVRLAVTAFPQQILPNKLLQEVRALAETAELPLPIVDELAADIFMGAFSEKFLRAAQKAGELLTGSLYERYYGISYDAVRSIDDVKPSRYKTATSPAFGRLCATLADATDKYASYSVARNGTIIEQEQVLTTHNLAVLFDALGLAAALQPQLPEMADRCLQWICRRLQQQPPHWHSRLQAVKNAAYAWRQMIFFLTLAGDAAVQAFLTRAADQLAKQRPDFQRRFQPALDGLYLAAGGPRPETPAGTRMVPIRFLGWTTDRHWLLQDET